MPRPAHASPPDATERLDPRQPCSLPADARASPSPPLESFARPAAAPCLRQGWPTRRRGHPIRAAATSAPHTTRRMRRFPRNDRGASTLATARSVASQPWLSSSAVAAWIARSVALTAAGLSAAMRAASLTASLTADESALPLRCCGLRGSLMSVPALKTWLMPVSRIKNHHAGLAMMVLFACSATCRVRCHSSAFIWT